MTDGTVDPEGKLTDDELCRLAAGQAGGTARVIIELALPAQRVEFEPREGPAGPRVAPHRVAPQSPGEAEEIARRTDKAEAFLRGVLAEPPVPLRAARAFAAVVTGEALRAIVASPLFKAVRKSRDLR